MAATMLAYRVTHPVLAGYSDNIGHIQKEKGSSGISWERGWSNRHPGQVEFLDKDAYSHLWNLARGPDKAATADADEGHSRLAQQNTGGSDALCLGAPLSQRSRSINGQRVALQSNPG